MKCPTPGCTGDARWTADEFASGHVDGCTYPHTSTPERSEAVADGLACPTCTELKTQLRAAREALAAVRDVARERAGR